MSKSLEINTCYMGCSHSYLQEQNKINQRQNGILAKKINHLSLQFYLHPQIYWTKHPMTNDKCNTEEVKSKHKWVENIHITTLVVML